MSTSSSPLIFANPRRPNLLESAKTMVFCAAFIILLFSSASRMSVVEIPKSRSIPSTPKKSFVNEQPRSISILYCPTTDTLLWRTMPPSWIISILSLAAKVIVAWRLAETIVSLLSEWILQANAWIVVPDARMIESSFTSSLTASAPMSCFSSAFSFSFSFTERLLVNGLIRIALPWLR